MPRPIIASPAPGPRHTLAAMGDSLTHNTTLYVRPDQFWPAVLADLLTAQGCRVRSRNFGQSGQSTAGAIARFGLMTRYDVPTLGVIWIGVNDPGNGIAGATTQANITAMAETLFEAGTAYVIIGNTQYVNWSTGGDTLETPGATYATLRTYQAAAADALIAAHPGKVAFCDIYTHMRNLIVDGTYAQGDAAWHVADGDQHLNAAGEAIVADAMYATIAAQPGWIDALKRG
jgi:lysophospholipase L1-like esterase